MIVATVNQRYWIVPSSVFSKKCETSDENSYKAIMQQILVLGKKKKKLLVNTQEKHH